MPNLKDLKNRIASVKNTRKITKAMQMVAAAKLRRAQEAAEQSRPYTERFNAVMAGLAASVGGSDSAPKLLVGYRQRSGASAGCHDVRAWLVRWFQLQHRQAGQKARAGRIAGDGKTVKILTVGKKGRDSIKRDFGDTSSATWT